MTRNQVSQSLNSFVTNVKEIGEPGRWLSQSHALVLRDGGLLGQRYGQS